MLLPACCSLPVAPCLTPLLRHPYRQLSWLCAHAAAELPKAVSVLAGQCGLRWDLEKSDSPSDAEDPQRHAAQPDSGEEVGECNPSALPPTSSDADRSRPGRPGKAPVNENKRKTSTPVKLKRQKSGVHSSGYTPVAVPGLLSCCGSANTEFALAMPCTPMLLCLTLLCLTQVTCMCVSLGLDRPHLLEGLSKPK